MMYDSRREVSPTSLSIASLKELVYRAEKLTGMWREGRPTAVFLESDILGDRNRAR
jgi:hypothetical protein